MSQGSQFPLASNRIVEQRRGAGKRNLSVVNCTLAFVMVAAAALSAQSAPTATFKVLYPFVYSKGSEPYGGLIESGGTFYGTTDEGGVGSGVVYSLTPGGVENVIHSFTGYPKDGSQPEGALVRDLAGNLYGTAQAGGSNGDGVIFKISSGKEIVLHDFSSSSDDGVTPKGTLIEDGSGNLYGTTVYGGTLGLGTVFKFATTTKAFTLLHSFRGGSDGEEPTGGLVLDSSGNLYGTASKGGAYGKGIAFKIIPDFKDEVILHNFGDSSDGQTPNGDLIFDPSGILYGTTGGGGTHGAGTVFKMTKTGSESVLYNFNAVMNKFDGINPQAGVVRDASGNLYGTTFGGGEYGMGTIFKLTPSKAESVLHSFLASKDGAGPAAVLLMDDHGNLYGTTSAAGAKGQGTVFELTP